ncbi:MAG: hypothetical protein ABIJ24_05800 [Nitrospinota bacterium]
MKRKYYALIAVVLFLVAIVSAVFYTMTLADRVSKEEIRISVVTAFPSIDVPGPATIKEMGELMAEKGELLARSDISYTDDLNLSLFGYHVVKDTGGGEAGLPATSYSLTMAFAAGKSRYCVIGGSFYTEGDVLPDGGKVALIEMDKVLIVRQGSSILVPLKENRWMSNK